MFNFELVAGDTDGLAFKKSDGKTFSPEERQAIVGALNSKMDELIRWEDDGVVKRQLVIKTKNYVLQDESGKIKIKGSALKATTKEKALQRFIQEVIDLLLKDRKDQLFSLYFKYANEVLDLKDISEWCVKKTVTKSVMNPERTNEQRVLDALEDSEYSEGDKVYMFNKTATELCLRDDFDGTYCVDTLLKKLYGTLAIFETVIDIELFPNFCLVRNREMLGLETKRKPKVGKEKPVLGTPEPLQTRPAFPDGFFQLRSQP